MPTSAILARELNGLSYLVNRENDRNMKACIGLNGLSAVVQVLAEKFAIDVKKEPSPCYLVQVLVLQTIIRLRFHFIDGD